MTGEVEREPKMTIGTSQMLDIWVKQEGNKYENLLVERGYLREEDRGDAAAIHEATRDWRMTYIGDLGLEDAEWTQETIVNPADEVLDARLGGWSGWMMYRPDGSEFTTFRDVAQAISQKRDGVPEFHLRDLPKLAADIREIAPREKIFRFRCGNDVAVVEGTHRSVGLALAGLEGLPTPDRLQNIYTCVIPEERREAFDRFCKERPVIYGKYYQEKKNT